MPTTNTNSNNYQPTQHSLIIGGSNSSINSLSVATSGQIPIGSTGADPVLGTITAGTNVSISNSTGSISISSAPTPTSPSSFALTQLDFIDDFLYTNSPAVTTDTNIFGDIWEVRLSGTSSSVDFNQGSGTANSPGWIQLNTGTTSSGKSGIISSSGISPFAVQTTGGAITFEGIAYIPVLSNSTDRYTLRIGLMDSVQAAPSNGCYFFYNDGNNSGQFIIICGNAGTNTQVNTSTAAVAGSWHNYKVVTNSAGNSVSFFIDGVQVGTSITTHIPTTTIPPAVSILKGAGTTNTTVQVDLITVNQVFNTPRPG